MNQQLASMRLHSTAHVMIRSHKNKWRRYIPWWQA